RARLGVPGWRGAALSRRVRRWSIAGLRRKRDHDPHHDVEDQERAAGDQGKQDPYRANDSGILVEVLRDAARHATYHRLGLRTVQAAVHVHPPSGFRVKLAAFPSRSIRTWSSASAKSGV